MQCLFDELRLVFCMLLRQLPKHQNTVMLKYCIIDFVYVHQVIVSLERTGIPFSKQPLRL